MVTPGFCSAFLISMRTGYYIDRYMLEETKAIALENLKVFGERRVSIVDKFQAIGVEGVDMGSGGGQAIYNNLDTIINNINNKITSENRVEVKRLLINIKEGEFFKGEVLSNLSKIIIRYNKVGGGDLKVPTFEELDTFFTNNKECLVGLGAFKKGISKEEFISNTAWSILKKQTTKEFKRISESSKKLRQLLCEIDTVDSNIANINYFLKYYNYIVGSGVERVYWLCFSDSRGRLYIKSPVSIQAN